MKLSNFLVIIILCIILILIYILNLYKSDFTNYQNIEYADKLSIEDIKNLKEGQLKMTNMLRVFDRICRKHNLKYWCVGGTLIGILRHRGWVPWDGDLDVAMLDVDYKKLQKIIQKELPKGMWFQDKTTDKYYNGNIGKIRDIYSNYTDYKNDDCHNGLQLDIFVFHQKGNKLYDLLGSGFHFGTTIEADIIFPLKEMNFENVKVYVPNNYKKYSIISWGDYPPKIPPVDKRFPHEGGINPHQPFDLMIQKYPELYQS